ncbi:MAG: ATP-binding protein, partial [Deltaproteobacteria bacterium]
DLECRPAGLVVEADRSKLLIAVGNLVDNALGFTNAGGHVLVAAGSAAPDSTEKAGYVEIEVVDDGIGIPASKFTKIFERFFQTENHMTRRRGGLGLGLPVAKSMVEMHHGKISVESVEGKGSRFCLHLPARQPKTNGNGQKPH